MKKLVIILIFAVFLIAADGCMATRESRLNRRHYDTEYGMGARHDDLVIIKHRRDRHGNEKVYKIRKHRKHHHRRDYDL